jgi:NAD+ synthase (glutamine-hydrolysing)
MRLVRLGLASVSSTVGAVRSNADRVLSQAREMEADGVTVACFPEQVLGGYPAEDLVQWRAFLADQRSALDRIAVATAGSGMIVIVGLAAPADGRIFNVAAVLHRGEILGLVPKEKLPTYNVFYEARTLARGFPGLALEADRARLGDFIFGFDFGLLAVEVCEDGWSPDGPMRRRCYSGAELVINLSASPFRLGVAATRREMLATRSADNQATLAYVNAVGGQDGLIFDGGGFVFQSGRPLLEAPPSARLGRVHGGPRPHRTAPAENSTWRGDCEAYGREQHAVPVIRSTAPTRRDGLVYAATAGGGFLPEGPAGRSPREEALDELFEALGIGVRDYYRKSGGFRGLAVALSGGRDSVLTLLVAWHAAHLIRAAGDGPGTEAPVTALYMPTRFSTEPTRCAARRSVAISAFRCRLTLEDAVSVSSVRCARFTGGVTEASLVRTSRPPARAPDVELVQ